MSNKTSDNSVAKIEDDIKLVKRYLENSAYKETDSDFFKNGGWEMVDLEIPKAMAHILAELEQMLKEREKYTIHLTDEEYRKVIESAQMDTSNYKVISLKFAVMQQQISEKDKRIQELEEELEEFNKQLDLDYVDENFISKQVVIDTMEELKTKRRKLGFKTYLRREDMLNEDKMIVCKIEVLQELLERKK